MTKEWCPDDCYGQEEEWFCDAPGPLSDGRNPEKDRCWHLDDVEIDPFEIEVKKTRTEWVRGVVVGENGDDWIVWVDNWNIPPSLSYINKNSPLIR